MLKRIVNWSTIGAFVVALVLVFVKIKDPMELSKLDVALMVSTILGIGLVIRDQIQVRRNMAALGEVVRAILEKTQMVDPNALPEVQEDQRDKRKLYFEYLRKLFFGEFN